MGLAFQNGKSIVLGCFCFFVFCHPVKALPPESSCWCEQNYSSYQEWIEAGNISKSSRKKICCYSKAISKASTDSQRADAYFKRGYAKYYYDLDVTGETWEKSTDTTGVPEGSVVNPNMSGVLTEEALVDRDERRYEGYLDYLQALNYNPNHSDALFEKGVYWYWKAFREEAKEEEDRDPNWFNWYETSHESLTKCIKIDKWCSTAYDLRSRVRIRLARGGQNRDEELRDILRQTGESNGGLDGYYFSGKGFSYLRKVYPKNSASDGLNFNWGGGEITPAVGSNNVTVRWIGLLEIPEEGSYQFKTQSDDGVRLWVNYELMIDNWTDHAPCFNTSGSISFDSPKLVPIKLEWYEHEGGAVIGLYWKRPGSNFAIIPNTFLYGVPSPPITRFPKFFEHWENDYNGWHLSLDNGFHYIVSGSFNDRLTSFRVPDLYDVTIYQHSKEGAYWSVSGAQNVSDLTQHWMIYNDKEKVRWDNQVSSVSINCKSGFGE